MKAVYPVFHEIQNARLGRCRRWQLQQARSAEQPVGCLPPATAERSSVTTVEDPVGSAEWSGRPMPSPLSIWPSFTDSSEDPEGDEHRW